ncbi:MAG: hypothetical protein HQ591_12370 [candidate division Zixibacteria bacterium]|nr:hypothetical protein [Candidatus Tariuqbacter arcticus]
MKRRENFIWGFLIVVAIVLAFYSGIRTYTISKQIREFRLEDKQDVRGFDKQLLETVTTLETGLKERMAYEFRTKKDPLKLSEVIRSAKLLAQLGYAENLEGEENMRLNLTVIGDNPYASIKYMGKFHNLRVGDTIGGYRVIKIDAKQAILRKGGRTLTLHNRPDPSSIAEQVKLTGTFIPNLGNY